MFNSLLICFTYNITFKFIKQYKVSVLVCMRHTLRVNNFLQSIRKVVHMFIVEEGVAKFE